MKGWRMVAPSSAYRHMQQDEDPCGSGCGADSAARDDGNDVRGGSDDDAAGGGIGTIRRGKRKRDPPIPFEALLNPDFEELARRYPAFRAAYHHRNTPPSSSIKGGGDDHDGDDANSRTAGRGSVNRPMQAAMATPQFRLELCRALLHRHWGLQLPTFDPDRNLCPPVPNRYYFVHWLKYTVLPGTRRWFQEDDHHLLESPPLVEPIRVLDIGTGSAAIYALLWAAAAASDVTQGDDSGNNEETEIYATDVDDESVLVAASNVAANQPHLWTEKKAKVHALKVEPTDHQKQRQHPRHFPSAHFRKGPMEGVMYSADGNTDEDEIPGGPLRRSLETVAALPCTQDNSVAPHPSRNLAAAPPPPTNRRFDLCLTNPPFFDLDEEPCPRADGQDRTAMTHHEGSYPGGEFGFLMDMITDGLYLHLRSQQQQQQPQLPPKALLTVPPRWSACMCGKKATYTKVRGILQYLLGPSRVASTEFGPGFTTRWFLAWTFDRTIRPRIDSPLAWKKAFEFDVATPLLGSSDGNSGPCLLEPIAEIEQRVRDYCASFPVIPLQIHASVPLRAGKGRLIIVRPTRAETSTDRDDSIPEPLHRVVSMVPLEKRLEWLPQEGNFSVEIMMREVAARCVGSVDPSFSSSSSLSSHVVIRLSVATVAHNQLGQMAVDKIQVQLESEVNRTNRKWRRILRRAQQGEPTEQRPSVPAPADAMDES